MEFCRAKWLAGVATGAMLLLPAVASAQDQSTPVDQAGSQPETTPETGASADVVVTARGREERLKDVPLQVDVVSEEVIKRQGLKDVLELTRLSPTFNYQATQRGQGTISIRGLNPNSFNVFRQGVSFFVDGLYIPGEVTSLNLQDLERVEVLKGPQATQFGRGTYAGAVNYITRSPSSNEVNGRFDAEVSTYGGHDVNGYVSFPLISDKLFAEVSARHYERGHRYRNQTDGQGVGDQLSINFAGILHWTPDDDTSIKLRYSHDYDKDANPAGYTLLKQDLTRFLRTFPSGATYPVFTVDFRNPELIGYGDATFDGFGSRDGERSRKRDVVALVASHDFGGYDLRYSGNYYSERTPFLQDVASRALGDPTLVNQQSVVFAQRQDLRATSQELRLTSPVAERFRWMVGANYFYIESRVDAPGLIGFFPRYSFTAVPGITRQLGTFKDEEIAGFASASYEFLDGLRLTAEGRFQSVRLAYDNCPRTRCLFVTGDFKRTENDFLPRVTIDYKPNDDSLVYALISQGVKNGAVNTTTTAATEAAFTAFANANYQTPERATNYEVGFKTSLFGNRLDLNGAAFLINVRDQQVTTFLPVGSALQVVTANGGTSNIKGGELTLTARPTPEWSINGGIGYARHRYTSDTATNAALITLYGAANPDSRLKGLTSVLTPRWSGNIATEYRVATGANSDVSLRADYTYTGKQFLDVPNLVSLAPIHRVGASVQFNTGEYAFTLFVKNLLDQLDPSDGATGNGNLSEPGTPRYFQQPSFLIYLPYGRIIGARASLRF